VRLSPHDDFGLRCLLQLARREQGALVTIPTIAQAEGIGPEHTAKLMRALRQGGLVQATRGASGGYRLARPANEITVAEVLDVLDGPLVPDDFCQRQRGRLSTCPHKGETCATGMLWRHVESELGRMLGGLTLADLTGDGETVRNRLHGVTLQRR
jgi:Rrf2 family protein